jgi:formylglycine-generating enzyme required for sulfatase activity
MVMMPADPDLGVAQAYCMDRFEASRPDATFTSMGSDTSMAVSLPNVIPWYVNPMGSAALTTFQAACAAAGKYLCTKEQWYAGCTGPERNSYVFGNSFDKETCNCVATFCDDYCVEWGIDPGSCNTATSNCGYHCGTKNPLTNIICFDVEPTGQYRDCVNSSGARDVNGNVWEVVPVPVTDDARGYEVRGGAFNCGAPATRFLCTYNAGWNSLYAGFRCCSDIIE